MSLTSFGSAAVKSLQMEAWKCIATGMMSEEETTGDGKIERRRPCWRSDRINNWMDELDRRGTDTCMESGQERRIDGPLSSYRPCWFACLDGEILAANTEPLIWWHLRSCDMYRHIRFDLLFLLLRICDHHNAS